MLRLTYYKLGPANYLTAASLAWDAALLQTQIELYLLSVKQPFYILVLGLVTKLRQNWSTGLNLHDFWTIFRA